MALDGQDKPGVVGFFHNWVDFGVETMRSWGGLWAKRVPIPEWVENLFGLPENASEKGKDWAYIVGHLPPVWLVTIVPFLVHEVRTWGKD